MKKGKKTAVIIVAALLSFVLLIVSAYFILVYMGKSQFHKEDTHISNNAVEIEDDTTITYKDQKYTLNKNIVSVLVMGVDRYDINPNLGSGKNGHADVIFVATVDTKTKKTCIIPISRETMVDINQYTTSDNYAGTKKEQICLAYAYGNSVKESSKNVMTSVKRLLYGINISRFVTVELDCVSKISNMVDGVPITFSEDITLDGVHYKKGQTANLTGSSAINYIRNRGDDIEANANRMLRQKQFLSSLLNKVGNAIMNDFTKIGSFYNELSPYFYTNVSIAQTTYLAQECLTMNFGDSVEYKIIDGSLSMGEKWVEFTPDENSMLQAVIDVFYTPKN